MVTCTGVETINGLGAFPSLQALHCLAGSILDALFSDLRWEAFSSHAADGSFHDHRLNPA